nr:DMT family transporter [Novosphingobium flavum]
MSAGMLATMLMMVKLSGEHGVALPETMFWRQFVPALTLLGWLAARGELHRVKTARPRLHAQRALIGTSAMFLTLGVVQLMPLAEATVLSFTAPIFAVILSVALLGEKVGRWRLGAVLLGLAGVIAIAGPDSDNLSPLGLAVGLGAAFGVALVSIQVRQMARTEEPICVVFWFSTAGAAMLSLLLPFYVSSHDAYEWALIGGIGLTGLLGQLLLTAALRYGNVSSVIVMDYSQIGWATLWGWLIFGQLPPDALWIGGPLIVAAGLIIARREQVLHRRPPIDPQSAPNAD